jgi:hypothetical protein
MAMRVCWNYDYWTNSKSRLLQEALVFLNNLSSHPETARWAPHIVCPRRVGSRPVKGQPEKGADFQSREYRTTAGGIFPSEEQGKQKQA